MSLLITSFLAGILTVLAPCVLTLLPVILGGSVGSQNKYKPLVVSLSVGISTIIFTLILKGTTYLIDIPQAFWQYFTGAVLVFFGLTLVFPDLWTKIVIKLKLYKSEEILHKNQQKEGLKGTILLGASLGPVFNSCSPTYLFIIGTVLPQKFSVGLANILAYTLGLMLLLIIIGYGGRSVAKKFKFAANPNGWFKKILGTLLILTGVAFATGLDKKFETYLIEELGYSGPINIENQLLENTKGEF